MRPRYALFALACAALLAPGLWFILRDPGEGAGAGEGSPAEPLPPALAPAEREHLEGAYAEQQASGEDQHGHEEPTPEVESTARAFLAAYLPYEVGDLGADAQAALRATTTSQFADQLLASAPRFPPGLERPPRQAELLAVDVVPIAEDLTRIVAKLRRGGDLEAAAFELRRLDGRWLISGVAG